VVRGEDGEKPVLHQGDAVTIVIKRSADKTDVNGTLSQPLLHVIIVTVEQFKFDTRIELLKTLDEFGQPVDGHAGEGTDAHGARVQPADGGDHLIQLAAGIENAAHDGEHPLTAVSEQDSRAAAQEDSKTQFTFQRADHMADAGLGIAERLGGLGQAAQFYYFNEGFVFADTHVLTS